MTILVLYFVTLLVFLGLDYFGLSYVIKPIFERDIGPLLLDNFRFGPALIFYAFYIGALVWFVSLPAVLQDRTLLWVLGNAALIGAMAYGTYEFSSLAVMKDWTWRMVVADLTWGISLTGVSATIGVWVARTLG